MSLFRATLLIALVAAPVVPTVIDDVQVAPAYQERDFLTRVRRLTVEGKRAGEGYWSPDGKRLVFQSEREPGNPFYQIYVLDLATGDTTAHLSRHRQDDVRVLPSRAATRSSSPRPMPIRNRSSTRTRSWRSAPPGKERRYSWDYDPEMDIYSLQREDRRAEAADDRARLRRRRQLLAGRTVDRLLVDARRLRPTAHRARAEAARARTRATSPRSTSCDADGSGPAPADQRPGYDGGPFFTPDGKRIVWRRFDEQGCIADVWTMKPDGSEQRQITDFGAMSWAPYMHPSGEYIHLRLEQARVRELRAVHGRRRRARRSRCASPTPTASTACRCPRRTGRQLAWTSSRAGGVRRAAVPRRSGTTKRRSRR